MNSQSRMAELIEQLRLNDTASQITAVRKGKQTDLGLINHYALHDLIPNKWFDWENRADARIMIIGQDWGPYIALKKYIDSYAEESARPDFDYSKFLFSAFSSRTEKFILKAVAETYTAKYGTFDPKIWDDIIFTMSVLFTRQGKHFRGNDNFDPKQSSELSYPYVATQLEIVKPKIIITLGGMAFDVINRYYSLGYESQTLTQVISEVGDEVITAGDTIIIPNFHPASYTDPKLQMQIWSKLWRNYTAISEAQTLI